MANPDDAAVGRLVDRDGLAAYLAEGFGEADHFAVERHAAGHSNETLFLTWGERELVLRRPPPGAIAETAHDVLREYRVVSALHGTAARVPTTVAACDDHDVIGCDFYLMDREPGDVIRDAVPERFARPGHRRRIGLELVDALAEVHAVDPGAAGLADLGRPAGFTARQVERWRAQFRWAVEVTADVRALPTVKTVGDRLEALAPDDHPESLVHGDYKLDNVQFAPGTPPRLTNVFDWELSTLGDPLTDLGWLLSFWRESGDPAPAVPDLQPTFMEHGDFATRRALVDRYERRTGRAYVNDRFYRALAVFKLGALGEMFFRRHLEGNSDDPLYPRMERAVPKLVERARTVLDGDEP